MTSQHEDLRQLVDNASKMSLHEFVQLADNVVELLSKENGLVGNQKITGRLIETPPKGEATIVGDLHGDLESLTQILKSSDFLDNVQRRKQSLLVFLGDYGDRGVYSPEVYYIVLKLKETFPENVVLMRGNHEGPDDLIASPHDLPDFLQSRFGGDWSTAYLKLKELFNRLYNAAIIRERCVMLHGGVPSQAKSLDDLAYAHLKHPRERHLEEILWSDPEEGIKGTYPSPRGAGRLFGPDITTRFLEMLNVNVLIRGHEPADEGFKINHNGRILTLFSRKGEPYFNSQGAYLQLELSSQVTNVFQLQHFVKLL
jgi:diadenosine tetraphosphatase ApaH/serine/threonine PP2A family protein phosphatase